MRRDWANSTRKSSTHLLLTISSKLQKLYLSSCGKSNGTCALLCGPTMYQWLSFYFARITDTEELMYLKDEYKDRKDLFRASGRRKQRTPSPSPPPPLPSESRKERLCNFPTVLEHTWSQPPTSVGTATFAEDRLYQVLVSCVNDPFSFYVQIHDTAEVRERGREGERERRGGKEREGGWRKKEEGE